MKSFTIILLIFLTLVNVESAGNSFSINSNTNSTSPLTRNSSLTTNINNFNTSIIGDLSSSAGFREKRDSNFALDPSEIARQNQITEQILSNYLERRLFPLRSVNQKIPTIAEILPKPRVPTARPRPRGFAASSDSFKRKGAKLQQRKTYDSSKKNRNSLFQRNKENKPTQNPRFEDDYEEVETEKSPETKSSHKREDSSNKDNINNDFVDGAVVEDVEEEADEEEPEIQEQNYQRHLRRQQQLNRHHYRYLEDDGNTGPDVHESLQSVESEQHDQYYNSNDSREDVFARNPSENEIDSGRFKRCDKVASIKAKSNGRKNRK